MVSICAVGGRWRLNEDYTLLGGSGFFNLRCKKVFKCNPTWLPHSWNVLSYTPTNFSLNNSQQQLRNNLLLSMLFLLGPCICRRLCHAVVRFFQVQLRSGCLEDSTIGSCWSCTHPKRKPILTFGINSQRDYVAIKRYSNTWHWRVQFIVSAN